MTRGGGIIAVIRWIKMLVKHKMLKVLAIQRETKAPATKNMSGC